MASKAIVNIKQGKIRQYKEKREEKMYKKRGKTRKYLKRRQKRDQRVPFYTPVFQWKKKKKILSSNLSKKSVYHKNLLIFLFCVKRCRIHQEYKKNAEFFMNSFLKILCVTGPKDRFLLKNVFKRANWVSFLSYCSLKGNPNLSLDVNFT